MMIKALCTALMMSATVLPVQNSLDDAMAEASRHSESVDQMLLASKDLRNFNLWGIAIMTILIKEPWVTPRVIEDKLRRLNIDVYLLARPMSDATVPPGSCARLPVDDPGRCRPYSLWIEVNGRERALERMKTFGADEAQNAERLTDTGFLILKRRDPI